MPWLWPALAACFLVTDAEWDEYVADEAPATDSHGDTDTDADADADGDSDTDADADTDTVPGGHSAAEEVWEWSEVRQVSVAPGTCVVTGSATCGTGPCQFHLVLDDAACAGALDATVDGIRSGAPTVTFDDGTATADCDGAAAACTGVCYQVVGGTDWIGGCVTLAPK